MKKLSGKIEKTIENQSIIKKSLDMMYVESGCFLMGSTHGFNSEQPVHEVRINSFYICKYPITVKQYRLFCEETRKSMPKKPQWGWFDEHPIVNVSWYDANEYCEWQRGRLPTEAEWEFAARGGNKTKEYKYSGADEAKTVAWYNTQTTNIVGKKKANELGLFDMSGNVWEWCLDCYCNYKTATQVNPKSVIGKQYVLRGGSWSRDEYFLRVTVRRGVPPHFKCNDVGFRLVMESSPEKSKQFSTLEKELALIDQEILKIKAKINETASTIL